MSAATSLLVAAIALCIFMVGLGDQYVWSENETRPGLVAREMVLHGHWLVPRLAGNVYPDKPPLFIWLVALLSPHGVSAWSLRLPAAVAAAATVGVTHALAARLFGGAGALVAAAVLAGSPAFVHWARTGRMESLLVLWITLTFWSARAWLDTGALRQAALAGFWMGLGVLTKGPFALVSVPAVTLASVARRAAGVTSRTGLVIGLGVALAVPAVWLVLCAVVDMTGFVDYGRAVIRAFDAEVALQRERPRPWSFQVVAVSAGFLPWTVLLPGAAVLLARSWRRAGRLLALPLAWVAVGSALFAKMVGPREPYFLMLYPPLAIVVGWAWSTATGRARLLLTVPLAVIVLGAVIVCVGGLVAPRPIALHGVSVPLDASLGVTLLVLVAAAAGTAVVLARAGRVADVGVVLGAAVLLVVLLLEIRVYTPAVNQRFPVPSAAERFASAMPPDAAVLYIDRKRTQALMLYLPQRPLEARDVADLRAQLDGTDATRAHFALLTRIDLEALQDTGCRPIRIAHQEPVDNTMYILGEFHPDPGCAPRARGKRTETLSQ